MEILRFDSLLFSYLLFHHKIIGLSLNDVMMSSFKWYLDDKYMVNMEQFTFENLFTPKQKA